MIYSYVTKRIEDGGFTGVSRFDCMLRLIFPEMLSVTRLPELQSDDIAITDNHMSMDVPCEIRTAVVHHGSACLHYERDTAWRNSATLKMCDLQQAMLTMPNRRFVGPSSWVLDRFWGNRPPGSVLIPHWVDRIEPLPKSGKPVIIGDWRDHNKGSAVWRTLAEKCPQWEFKPIIFLDDAGRRKQYGEASLYLCLSLSEGGAYAVCDAEAAELPIVTTDVGNYREFDDCDAIPWQSRDDVEAVIAAIERKLRVGRQKASFYQNYTFEIWAEAWRRIVQ